MITRLGIGIGSREIRAVLVRSDRVLWHGMRPLPDLAQVRDSLASLLGDAPLPRFPKARAIVAIGPSMAQAKRLSGLPALAKPAMVSQLVRTNVARFFLKNGIPLAAGPVHRSADAWW